MGFASTRPARPGPICLTAPGLAPQCASHEPPSPPAVLGARGRESYLTAGDGIKSFFHALINPGATMGLPQSAPRCGTSDLGHGANVKTREFFSSRLLSGSDTGVLTSAKNCPSSTVLTASLPAVTAAARRCNFHSDAAHSRKKKEKPSKL